MAEPKVVTGKRVYLNIGHGQKPDRFDPGAVHASSGKTEFDLNTIAAASCKAVLESAGHEVTVGGNEAGNNYGGGKRAAGHDVCVSLHHNSAGSSAQGSECFFHRRKVTDNDRHLAAKIAWALSNELGIRNRGPKEAGLSVLSGAKDAGCPVAVLAELYFMQDQTPANPPASEFEDWSRRGGEAIGRAINEFLA
jgi:N-acetylmuramoyl-L-alanine amidase